VNELESLVAEMAGRDSFAAVLKYCEKKPDLKILPTYVHAPTEYGDFSIIQKNVDDLARVLKERYGIEVESLIVMDNPRLWAAINGRFISLLVKTFGFHSPCLGCHLYMHIMRAPLAKELGSKNIISGERESHSGEIKLNQTARAIDAYSEVLKSAGIDLLLPIREISENSEIEKIVGTDWKASEKQMECVLSGNYRELMPSEESLDDYLQKFLIPVGKKLLSALLEKNNNYLEIVKETLCE
jgi:hypothetical protein